MPSLGEEDGQWNHDRNDNRNDGSKENEKIPAFREAPKPGKWLRVIHFPELADQRNAGLDSRKREQVMDDIKL
jgi:hypothetical protein